jgi:hypothetical protein
MEVGFVRGRPLDRFSARDIDFATNILYRKIVGRARWWNTRRGLTRAKELTHGAGYLRLYHIPIP